MAKKVLLIHTSNTLLHYRVSIYNFFSFEFKKNGFEFFVLSNRLQADNPYEIKFNLKITKGVRNFWKEYNKISPEILFTFCSLKDYFVYPIIFSHKKRKKKLIYWGHGINLNFPNRFRFLFNYWHKISDTIILYSRNEVSLIKKKYHQKVLVANNTLNFNTYNKNLDSSLLKNLNIKTDFNVIFVGRIERRKKIHDLLIASEKFKGNIGLIIIGEDREKLLPTNLPKNVHYLGPIYGYKLHSILNLVDVFCLPGHVGLSIVDAFYFGLPLISQEGFHAPEISYLKNGLNGFMTSKDDPLEIAKYVNLLYDDRKLLKKMSRNAVKSIKKEGDIKKMFLPFLDSCK